MTSPNITSTIETTPPTDLPDQAPPSPRWTPAKQKTFLEALARCGSVKSSAAYAGMSRESAYRLRRKPEGKAFARAWDAALIHARDLFADELLDKGMNGWTGTVWYHGEEVGERSRFSAGLLLSALGRLDKKADGLDLAGHPARAAVHDFDTMVEAIGKGEDCTDMLAEQEAALPLPQANEPDDRTIIDRLETEQARDRINAAAPEEIDRSGLDLAEAETWDDLQWLRAERSGMMDEPGFWEAVDPDGELQEPAADGEEETDPQFAVKGCDPV
ncbi:hypothetical protein [Parasphingorhabdus halotolerans]|uniref:Terminase small subunit n=1 Tax=Parasphingorhabdus halotolerans TaxID=2725558 RepID=A0A6H2DMG5_9SPHN|nr:hypothetical protein [Parasphingorhabdus halotolerans]QJB69544.1 hypothetical protein HF685_09845 [Parasphingorhabdus halotolerans]